MTGGEAGSVASRRDRLERAASDHVITQEMSQWGAQVRLETEPADPSAPLPSIEEASGSVEFVNTLATSLFVLPGRVTRGLKDSKPRRS